MTSAPFSLYIHVPFCARKCPYCDFNTYATSAVPEEAYVEALCRELRHHAEDSRLVGRSVATVFFGGGTPSLISPRGIGRVIECARELFSFEPQAEVTLEANPGASTSELLGGFRDVGVNRVSFGAQSFSEARLKLLGRDHSADEASAAVERAVAAGISNVSLDLIVGVPDQTLEDLERDLSAALSLPITHLSTYALTIEPGTPFFQRQERGLLVMPPDSLVARMLERLPEIVEPRGLRRYEISNYARDGRESAHNMAYWTGGDYIGIGAGAHSYLSEYEGERLRGAERWSVLALPESYMRGTQSGVPVSWRERLDEKSLAFEFFYLGLRMIDGVKLDRFRRRFGDASLAPYEGIVRDLVNEGFMIGEGDTLRLSHRGLLVADSVFERMVR